MGECLRCGTCCRAIAFPQTKAELRRMIAQRQLTEVNLASACFIIRHWRRLGRQQASAAVPTARPKPGYVYYHCTWLADNLCCHYVLRPPICRGFPYYEDPPDTDVDDRLPSLRYGYHSSRRLAAEADTNSGGESHA